VDRAAEPHAAAFEVELAPPLRDDFADLREHPIAAAVFIGGARFRAHHAVAVEGRDLKFGAADIYCQNLHFSRTSSGDAVPVPFFMMVMDATRLPNCAASIGSLRLPEPAPRPPRSCRRRRKYPRDSVPAACEPTFAAFVDHEDALAAMRHHQQRASRCRRSAA
jgi:hypothetical protein